MLHSVIFLIISCRWLESVFADKEIASDSDFGKDLISSLKNDANLDLSVDEEYEDLRAEALAYHSALASLRSSRKSLMTTECWKRGGICISFKLCPGYRQLTEVPGCKNRYNVCCFVWNQFEVRDLKDKGIGNLAFPWSLNREYGGEGIREVTTKSAEKVQKKKKKKKSSRVTNETLNDYKRL